MFVTLVQKRFFMVVNNREVCGGGARASFAIFAGIVPEMDVIDNNTFIFMYHILSTVSACLSLFNTLSLTCGLLLDYPSTGVGSVSMHLSHCIKLLALHIGLCVLCQHSYTIRALDHFTIR